MKRFLRLTKEQAYGVFDLTSPVQINIRLDQPDSFRVMTSPEIWQIMSGSGFAVPALNGTEVTGLACTLQTPLLYTHAPFLLDSACTRINAGQTLPWVTTELAGDLPSFSADFAWTNFDGTIRRKRFLGIKVATMGLSGSRDSPVMRLSLGLIGSTPQGNSYDGSSDPSSGELPEPADSTFATNPVLFEHLRGGVTINNAARTNFQSISISVQNKIKAYFDEFRFANAIRLGGRTVTVSGTSRLKASPDERALYEANTNLASANTLVFTNAVNTITLAFLNHNYYSSMEESLPLDEEIYFNWTMQNALDAAQTAINPDFTFTYA